jgi:anti-sigma-K factor RskA
VNINEYISGGAVENYVLGLLSEAERQEFEQLCLVHPELRAAREAFELALEKQILQGAVPPPAELKKQITDKIFLQPKAAPPTAAVKKIPWRRWAVAASLVLLAGSIWWNMKLLSENRILNEHLGKARDTIGRLVADAAVLQKEGIKMVGLGGTANSPHSFATVYWDTTSHDVYLLVNNLPRPASDEQYQLWAILKSGNQLQPVDLGFIEISEKPLQLYRMKNAREAQAFAITLERKDDNDPGPNLQRIYVMGNL